MASMCNCPCLRAQEEDKLTTLAPIDDRQIKAKAPTSPESMKRESQRKSQKSSEADDGDQDIEESSFDTLLNMAKSLWESAASYLTSEEQDEFTDEQLKRISRMNTLELRNEVKATKNANAAQKALMDDEGVAGEDVARAQRAEMNARSGSVSFDGDVFATCMKDALDEKTGDVNAALFLEAANAVPILMGGLGRAMAFGNSELMSKLEITERRMKETAEHLEIPADEVTLQQMVELDIEKGTTHAGKKAAPASRNILRLLWFTEFISVLLLKLGQQPKETLKKICSETYEETLGPRHMWVLRKAARSGMSVLPPKDVFRKRLGTVGISESEECKKLIDWGTKVQTTSEKMWEYMRSVNLAELP